MDQTRTLDQALADLTDILTWYRQIPGEPQRQISYARTASSTNTESRLPFGLDAVANNLDDGYAGIRTTAGAVQWLRIVASWLWSSDWPATIPNQRTPGSWIKTMLETPYPWETWADWDSFAEELFQGRRHIGRMVGHVDQYRYLCPRCGGSMRQRMLDKHGREDQLSCLCGATYDSTEDILRALRTCTVPPDLQVAQALLIKIWEAKIDPKKMRIWIKRGHLTQHPDGSISLWTANAWLHDRLLSKAA